MSDQRSDVIAPYGGALRTLVVDAAAAADVIARSRDCPSWSLTPRQVCDLELLLNGGFSPLSGFMTRTDYRGVCSDMRLADGTSWPIPITLDVSAALAEELTSGNDLALRDGEGVTLALLRVEDVWQPDRDAEAAAIVGTTNPEHPGVRSLAHARHPYSVGGRVQGLQLPAHYDYQALRLTPVQMREEFVRLGWRRVVAFQTSVLMHRAHQELTLRTAADLGAELLIHAVVGPIGPGDLDHYTRVRCYKALLPTFPPDMARLALLPLTPRGGGPRETLWRAIISRNYGCAYVMVYDDHESGGLPWPKAFDEPREVPETCRQHQDEIGVTIVPVGEMQDADGARSVDISEADIRARLDKGLDLPSWLTLPEVAAELRRRHPPRDRQGCTIFFTGLSGAGKSTIANVLRVNFLEAGDRPVTLLDGDLVRQQLSSELGFSREHRNVNVRRIGYVASEITKNGGVAICAPIAPYDEVRKEVRRMIEPLGGFVLVHVATPLDICEQRDRKGLYAKARAGIVKEFTGISDPYEPPDDAEVVIDTTDRTPEEAAQEILMHLRRTGYVR